MIFMDEENKEPTIEKKEEKKENIVVIKKSKLIIVVVSIIIIIGIIIGLRYFGFFNPVNGKIEVIANDSPVLGSSNATIYVVEFSDYECPYCQASEGTNQEVIATLKQRDPTWEAPIPKVIEEYVNTGKVKLVFRNFPVHGNREPANAAKCAQEQGKFWEYHQKLFENYNALTDTDLKKYAADLSLNLSQFTQCLDSKKYENIIQNDLKNGNGLGVSGTPTFFVGNEEKEYEKIVGAQSFSDFKQIIDSKISV